MTTTSLEKPKVMDVTDLGSALLVRLTAGSGAYTDGHYATGKFGLVIKDSRAEDFAVKPKRKKLLDQLIDRTQKLVDLSDVTEILMPKIFIGQARICFQSAAKGCFPNAVIKNVPPESEAVDLSKVSSPSSVERDKDHLR